MSNSATLDPTYPLENSMGAMMVGVIVSAVLHGLCLLQAFFYFTKYKDDVWFLKALVMTIVTFDAVHLFLISHAVYHYVVVQYHDPNSLQYVVWSVVIEALFTGVNAGIVQTFYTFRVWRLSKGNLFLTGTILMLILATTGCGVAWVVLSMQVETYRDLLRISPLTITINALSTTVDVTIAVSLVIMLHKARTGFKRSDSIIKRLIVFVVNTGVLTSCCAIAALISLVVSPHSLVYASFYFCIGRFYTNSFLATLNARKSLTTNVDDTSHMLVSIPPSVISGSTTAGSRTQNISIRIDTTKEGLQDVESTAGYNTRTGDDSRSTKKGEL